MSIFKSHENSELIKDFAVKLRRAAKTFLTMTKNFSKENFSNEKEIKDLIRNNYSGFKTSISYNVEKDKEIVILTIYFSEIVEEKNRKKLVKDFKGLKKYGMSLKRYKDYAIDVKIPFSLAS